QKHENQKCGQGGSNGGFLYYATHGRFDEDRLIGEKLHINFFWHSSQNLRQRFAQTFHHTNCRCAPVAQYVEQSRTSSVLVDDVGLHSESIANMRNIS